MKKIILSSAFLLFFNLATLGQSQNSGALNITNDLGQFFSHNLFENAYLQFDKPYYASGDTIYFKAYVTQGEEHKPSGLSGVLHVDLIDPENKIDQSIELHLVSGIAWGDFTLPDSLPAGNYRIRIGGQLSTSLNGRLRGVGFSRFGVPYLEPPLGDGPMLVVIDGTEMNTGVGKGAVPFDINDIPSSQVETVEVLKYASVSMYGMDGGNGVLVITTKNGGDDPEDIVSVGILPIAPMGFYKAREFYSPKYDHTNENSNQSDLRSIIYWNPEIKTGKDGNASFDYYNADGTGTYKVTIEGIDDNGNVGRIVYKYKVE